MILTCPRCATRYLVGEDEVRPQGRKVKCTACGELWTAWPPVEEPPLVAAEPEVPAFEMPAVAPVRDEVLDTLRARARGRRQARGRFVLWGGMATLAAAAVVAAVFQPEIERQWPLTARAYSAVGL
jgi:predicted Zn finger-like uncharacterized protein